MNWLDAQSIIDFFGDWATLAVAAVVFAETAFIPTSILPGDSLLFLLGLTLSTATSTLLPFWAATLMIWSAAVAGSQLGYLLGRRYGSQLFAKDRGWFFNRRIAAKTEGFFKNHGVRAVIIARFIPVLRAVVPTFAGISKMPPAKFTLLNLIGASIWVGLFVPAGYFLGQIDFVRQHLEIVVLTVVLITSLPLPIEFIRYRVIEARNRRQLKSTNTNEVPMRDRGSVGL
jgi:membrane-associated protein